MLINYVLILLLILIIIVLILVIKNKNLKEICSQQANCINKNFEKIEKLSKEKENQYERIIELEDGINDRYGVSIRKEITEVISEFTKLEMVIILSGITLLLERTNTSEDAQHYINLINKVNLFLKNMKEEEDKIFKRDDIK